MSAIFSFNSYLYLNPPTNILRCFCCLKFESSSFSNKLFTSIFRRKRAIYPAEYDQIKYLFQTSSLKSHFSMCKLLLDFAATAMNYISLSLRSLSKDLFTIRELQVLYMYYTMNDHHIRLNTCSKHKKKGTI